MAETHFQGSFHPPFSLPCSWIPFNEEGMEAASRGSKQSRHSHFDAVPTELHAPCLPPQILPWLTLPLMCKLLWTSHMKFPSGHAHFYSPSTGFTSGSRASGGDKMNLQELWIWHQNGARVSSNWILLGLNFQGKSTSFVCLEFREKRGRCG